MSVLVNWRLFCAEVSSREGMERKGMQILAEVGSNFSENEKGRKNAVSSALIVNRGLVST